MISAEIKAHIRRLVLVERWSIETVARRFGVHHGTVRRALAAELPTDEPARSSVVDPHKQYIVDRLTEHPQLRATRLFQELKERGYQNGVAQLRRYIRQVRMPRMRKAYFRIDTEPGEEAQVDWGSFGHFRIGNSQRPLSAFSMVLSWSRALYIDFSLDQRMETFCRMHRHALEFFGGVPRRILYDNLKSVVLRHVGATVQFNPRFATFAGHYLFEPVAAPVRYPEAKGKVEASIKYLRQSFFYGRTFATLADLRAQAAAWRDDTANARLHASTRERPVDRLLVERTRLHTLPAHPFDTDLLETAIVSKQACVFLDTNSYSVPPELVGKTVQVRASDVEVSILHEGKQIAVHPRCWERRRTIERPEHLAKMLERRPGATLSRSRDRLASLCPEAALYLKEVARSRVDLQTETRKLTRLLEQYGPTELASGLASALAKRTFGAGSVRTLLDQARFARGLTEPPEPVLTGNALADNLVVEAHALETYDELVPAKPKPKSDQ